MAAEVRQPRFLLGLMVSLLLHIVLLACAWLLVSPSDSSSGSPPLQAVLRPPVQQPVAAETEAVESIDAVPAAPPVESVALPSAVPMPRMPSPEPDAVVAASTPADPPVESALPDRPLDLSLPRGLAGTTHPLFIGSGDSLPVFDAEQEIRLPSKPRHGLPVRNELPLAYQPTTWSADWRDLERRTPYQVVSDAHPALGFALGLFQVGPKINPNCPMYMKLEDCESPFPTTR